VRDLPGEVTRRDLGNIFRKLGITSRRDLRTMQLS
jgi:hypothetical protein